MQSARGRWLLRLGLGGALLGAVLWIYRDLFTAELTNWDDDRFITANPLFAAGGWPYVRAAFTEIQWEAYHPLHVLSYLPDRTLWPAWPTGFHLVNLALFVADLVLLWRLVRRHCSELAAFAAVALFALHPLCVEPVAWVADRKEPLVVLFFVLALGRETAHTGPRPRPGAIALFLCALLSKTSSVCFPIVLFGWLLWIQRRPLREAVTRSAAYAVVTLVVSVVVILVWRDHGMIVHRAAPPPVEVATTLAAYAGHVVWPVDLSPAYPLDASHATAAVVACAIAALAIAAGWRWLPPRARFTVIAVGAAVAPVSNLVPMTLRMSDRYLYLALAMLVLPVASLIDWLIARDRRAIPAIAAVALVIAGLEARLSAQLAAGWHDSRALWTRAVEAQPRAFLARLKYAEVLEADQRWTEALAQLRDAQQLNLGNPLPAQRLIHLHARRGELDGSLPAGTALRWLRDSERAVADRAVFQQLAAEIDAAPCRRCGDALALIGVSVWPRSDADLIAEAQRAIDQRLMNRARIYLGRVRDRSSPELAELERRAARAPTGDL
ncbi:MAG TPA: hypothetical protein VK601_11885 [Kofleriaceae bacterium]|nr:hypothetical protein [Kofleriaceae bacterium]